MVWRPQVGPTSKVGGKNPTGSHRRRSETPSTPEIARGYLLYGSGVFVGGEAHSAASFYSVLENMAKRSPPQHGSNDWTTRVTMMWSTRNLKVECSMPTASSRFAPGQITHF